MSGSAEAAGKCDCSSGRVWLTEADLLAEVIAKRGTGDLVSFSFGFGGRERTWRACTKCTTTPGGAS